jgi:nucleotide-binding universal stress UspA family protein
LLAKETLSEKNLYISSKALIWKDMKTKLIVLVDFSSYSETLIKLAKEWSGLSGAEIVLVHKINYALPAMTDSVSRNNILQYEKGKALTDLRSLASENRLPQDKTTYQVFETGLTSTLSKLQAGNYNDLIITGLKGGGGTLSKILFGSTTLQVIEELNKITIALPVILQNLTPKILTVATHYKFPLNKNAFEHFLKTSAAFAESIQFISVKSPDENYKKCHEYLLNLSQEFNHILPSSFELFEGVSALAEIKNFTSENPNTMVVVQKGSRSFSDYLFRKFFINELINNFSLPLIVLPL